MANGADLYIKAIAPVHSDPSTFGILVCAAKSLQKCILTVDPLPSPSNVLSDMLAEITSQFSGVFGRQDRNFDYIGNIGNKMNSYSVYDYAKDDLWVFII